MSTYLMIQSQYPYTKFIKLSLILLIYINRMVYIDEEHSIKNPAKHAHFALKYFFAPDRFIEEDVKHV